MNASRVVKRPPRPSSTKRRLEAAKRIESLGRQFVGMGRCSNCVVSDSPCWMLEGQSLCNTCKSKNKKVGECDGCFSASDFDNLQDQRERLQREAAEKDRRIGELIAALTQTQREKDEMQAKIQRLFETQKKMLSRELEALDVIDGVADSSTSSSSPRLAFSLDPAFVPALEQMVDFSAENLQFVP